jgi:hypothetical protein
MKNFGKKSQKEIAEMTVDEARRLYKQGQFPPGSMGPKIDASIRFVEASGSSVLITDAPRLARALHGESGTYLRPSNAPPEKKKKKKKGKRGKGAKKPPTAAAAPEPA